MPFSAKILQTAARNPERIALKDRDGEVSYGEIVGLAGHIYSALGGSSNGERITIAISEERALDAAFLVAALSGFDTTILILDTKWPLAHKERAVIVSSANVLVTGDEALEKRLQDSGWQGNTVAAKILFEKARENKEKGAIRTEEYRGERPAEEPFLLIFTSGTTDLPKGFYRTRAVWRHNLLVSKKYLRAEDKARTIAPGPLAYSLTLYALVEVLGTGGTLFLQSRFSPQETTKTIEQHDFERLVAVPAVLPSLTGVLRRKGSALTNLKEVILGGAALTEKVWKEFTEFAQKARLRSYYGAAEIGFIGYSDDPALTELHIFEGAEIEIRDTDGKPMEKGQIGTIYVRVPSQAKTYLQTTGGEEITGKDGWSTVKDHGMLTENGLILAGREGDMVVSGGHNVSLQQVDRALHEITGAENAIAVGLSDPFLETLIVAVIESNAAIDVKQFQTQLRSALPPQYVPRRIYVAQELPRTVGGKIRRAETTELLEMEKYERVA